MDDEGSRRTSWDACVLDLSCVRLILVNYKVINIWDNEGSTGTSWDDEGSRRDIAGCVRLSFKLRAFSFS